MNKHYSIQAADDFLESDECKKLIEAMKRSDSYHQNIAWRLFMAGFSAREKMAIQLERISKYDGKIYKKD